MGANVMNRIEREKQTVCKMIGLFCRHHLHHDDATVLDADLHDLSHIRLPCFPNNSVHSILPYLTSSSSFATRPFMQA